MPDAPLTGPQIKALEHLALRQYATPSELGYACATFRNPLANGQAAGRVGGRMGTRLTDMGLARDYREDVGGYLRSRGYAITPAGLKALRQAGIVPIKGPHAGGEASHG